MKTQLLMKIGHNYGFGYTARTNGLGLSSHKRPSAAVLLENGIPLPGPANAVHDEIRNLGNGRYSFWFGKVYFSASDNSDPRTNGRLYSIQYPEDELSRLSILDEILYRFVFSILDKIPRFGRLNGNLYRSLKSLLYKVVPVSIRKFLLGILFNFEAIRRLGPSFTFWSIFYWLSFFYVASLPRKD
ncbi:MAG TPA: hypothetical protein VKE92_11225 [Anaerolineales bacterium]|nr:hypothetical protein [Anaerolineales bacterium]